MAWLGVRCWKDKIALVVVAEGDPPEVEFRRRQPSPAINEPAARAGWFGKVVREALNEVECEGVSVRVADTDPDQLRAEAEGAVFAAAGAAGLPAKRFRRQSLLKPLGVERSAGAWQAFQKSDAFIGGFVGDEKDAAMASLAALRA